MQHRFLPSRSRGFTLMELAVVLVINTQACAPPPGCAADGFTIAEELSWDGQPGSGYYNCDEVYGSCPYPNDGVNCCSRATTDKAWTRSRCN